MDSPAQSTEDTVADAFGVLSAAITAIDPALLTRSPMPQSPAPTPFSIYPNPLPDFQSAQPIITSPKPISFNDPFAQRALSEPPEQPHSTHPYPAALQNRQARNNGYLHHPYNRPSPSPTSGPPASVREAYRSQSTSHLYNLHHDETTLALGIQTYLDQLIGVCNEMRTFVSRGFGEGDRGGDNERRVKVEK